MALTKAQILALPDNVVNDLVAEQVMQWTRGASLATPDGGISMPDGAFQDNTGNVNVTRPDGTVVSAPVWMVRPMGQLPNFALDEWVLSIMRKMAIRNFTLTLLRSGANVSVSFLPAGADPVVLAVAGDAVRRAALFAVQ